MFIRHPNRTNNITEQGKLKLNGSEIKRVNETKSFGVIIAQGLNWEDQFKAIKGKGRGGLASSRSIVRSWRII